MAWGLVAQAGVQDPMPLPWRAGRAAPRRRRPRYGRSACGTRLGPGRGRERAEVASGAPQEPMPAVLRDHRGAYLADASDGRLFAGIRYAYDRGRAAATAAGVEPATLHQCRDGYASLMIAAGVNVFCGVRCSRRTKLTRKERV